MILAAITTCRRDPAMVERAVKSVIAQTYTDWNLVVVDDSPSDYELREDVRKMVESYAAQDSRIRYVPHDKNYGAQRARNNALKIADKEGFEFIAYLDDDDEWLPEKLEKQISRFNECGENTCLVYCSFYSTDENIADYKRIVKFPNMGAEGNIYAELLESNFVAMLTLIRTKRLVEVGGFDESMSAFQDWDTWLRLSMRYDFAYVNEPLALIYIDRSREHILGSYTRIIKGLAVIEGKHDEFLTAHPYTHWRLLRMYLQPYLLLREYRKFLSCWLKMFRLRPQNKKDSISIMFSAFYDVIKAGIKSILFKINPKLFYKLKKAQA